MGDREEMKFILTVPVDGATVPVDGATLEEKKWNLF